MRHVAALALGLVAERQSSMPASAPRPGIPEIRIEHEAACPAHDAGKPCASRPHWRASIEGRTHGSSSLERWTRQAARTFGLGRIRVEELAPAERLAIVVGHLRSAGFRAVEISTGSATTRIAMPAAARSRPAGWSTIRVRRVTVDRVPEMDVVPGREADRAVLRDFVRGKAASRPATASALVVLIQPAPFARVRDVLDIVRGLSDVGVRTIGIEPVGDPSREDEERER